jgi:hypothetical protein
VATEQEDQRELDALLDRARAARVGCAVHRKPPHRGIRVRVGARPMSRWFKPQQHDDSEIGLEVTNAIDSFGTRALDGIFVNERGTSYKVFVWTVVRTTRGESRREQKTRHFKRGFADPRGGLGGRWIQHASALESAVAFKDEDRRRDAGGASRGGRTTVSTTYSSRDGEDASAEDGERLQADLRTAHQADLRSMAHHGARRRRCRGLVSRPRRDQARRPSRRRGAVEGDHGVRIPSPAHHCRPVARAAAVPAQAAIVAARRDPDA